MTFLDFPNFTFRFLPTRYIFITPSIKSSLILPISSAFYRKWLFFQLLKTIFGSEKIFISFILFLLYASTKITTLKNNTSCTIFSLYTPSIITSKFRKISNFTSFQNLRNSSPKTSFPILRRFLENWIDFLNRDEIVVELGGSEES